MNTPFATWADVCGLEPVTILAVSEIEPGANLAALLAFFACLCGVYLFGQGLLAWRRRNRSKVPPATAIRSIRPGAAEIHGVAESPHTITAAVSGKDCYFYKTTIWQEDSHKSGGWKKAAEETFSLPFFLTDNTGRILLDSRGAEIDFPRDVYEEYGKTLLSTHTDVPERLEAFLVRHSIAAGAAIRVEEYSIAPAAQVFARGTIVKNADGLDLTAAPLDRVEGRYCPAVHSTVPEAVAPDAGSSAAPISARAETDRSLPSQDGSKDGSKETSSGAGQAAVQPEVIRLSLPSLGEPPEEMTMQSRLAAALRRANAKNPDTWGMPMPEAQTANVAIQERSSQPPAKSEAPLQEAPSQQKAAPAVEAPAKKSPKLALKRSPPLILRKGTDGSVLLLSAHSPSENPKPSGMTTALVFAGPALTLAGAYYLLLNFGWL